MAGGRRRTSSRVVKDLQDRGNPRQLFIEPEAAAVSGRRRLAPAHRALQEPFAHRLQEGEEAADRSLRRYVEAANLAHALRPGESKRATT